MTDLMNSVDPEIYSLRANDIVSTKSGDHLTTAEKPHPVKWSGWFGDWMQSLLDVVGSNAEGHRHSISQPSALSTPSEKENVFAIMNTFVEGNLTSFAISDPTVFVDSSNHSRRLKEEKKDFHRRKYPEIFALKEQTVSKLVDQPTSLRNSNLSPQVNLFFRAAAIDSLLSRLSRIQGTSCDCEPYFMNETKSSIKSTMKLRQRPASDFPAAVETHTQFDGCIVDAFICNRSDEIPASGRKYHGQGKPVVATSMSQGFVGVAFCNPMSSSCERTAKVRPTLMHFDDHNSRVAEEHLNEKHQLGNSNSFALSGCVLTDFEAKETRDYRTMLRAGMSPVAVTRDIIRADQQNKIETSESNGSDIFQKVSIPCAGNIDPYSKFSGMIKAGVPMPAVRHKMQLENIPIDTVDEYLNRLNPENLKSSDVKMLSTIKFAEEVTSKIKAADVYTPDEMAMITRFKAMLKNGVPSMAVQVKMKAESASDRILEAVVGPTSIAKPPHAIVDKRRNGLVNVHWEVLELDQSQIERSIWACHGSRDMHSTSTSGEDLLVKFFSKKAAVATMKKTNEACPKKTLKSVLDNTRIQNITIALRSFKDIDIANISLMVNSLSHDAFTTEQLIQLQNMVPSDIESKAIVSWLKTSAVPNSAELFCSGFSAVKRTKEKISTMIYIKNFESTVESISMQLRIITNACEQAISSVSLSKLLNEVLRVGNVMNAGTTKGEARGIKIEGLLKLSLTKSTVDANITLLDFLAEILLEKSGKGKGEELLNFYTDIPDLDRSFKISVGDLSSQLTVLNVGLEVAKLELGTLINDAAEETKAQKLSSIDSVLLTNQIKTIKVPETSIESDPKAALMAMLLQRGNRELARPKGQKAEGLAIETSQDPAVLNEGTHSRSVLCAMLNAREGNTKVMKGCPDDGAGSREIMLDSTPRSQSHAEDSTSTSLDKKIHTETYKTIQKAKGKLILFLERASACLRDLHCQADNTKFKAEELADYFGDRSQDSLSILSCISQFAALTREARAKADQRKLMNTNLASRGQNIEV